MSDTIRKIPHWFNTKHMDDPHVIGRVLKGADGTVRNVVATNLMGVDEAWSQKAKKFFKRRINKKKRKMNANIDVND